MACSDSAVPLGEAPEFFSNTPDTGRDVPGAPGSPRSQQGVCEFTLTWLSQLKHASKHMSQYGFVWPLTEVCWPTTRAATDRCHRQLAGDGELIGPHVKQSRGSVVGLWLDVSSATEKPWYCLVYSTHKCLLVLKPK